MRRRVFFRAMQVLPIGCFSGCVANFRERGDDVLGSDGEQNPSRNPITSDDVEFGVTIVRSFAEKHPARLRVELTNASEDELTLSGDTVLPFADVIGEHDDADVRLLAIPDGKDWLVPTGADSKPRDIPVVPAAPVNGCWTVPYSGFLEKGVSMTRDLQPGASVSHVYTLLAGFDGACLAPGAYTFSHQVVLRRTRQTVTSESRGADAGAFDVTLSFTVHVDKDWNLSVAVSEPVVRAHEHADSN